MLDKTVLISVARLCSFVRKLFLNVLLSICGGVRKQKTSFLVCCVCSSVCR